MNETFCIPALGADAAAIRERKAAIAEMFTKCYARLYAICRRCWPLFAEDAVQEGILKVVRRKSAQSLTFSELCLYVLSSACDLWRANRNQHKRYREAPARAPVPTPDAILGTAELVAKIRDLVARADPGAEEFIAALVLQENASAVARERGEDMTAFHHRRTRILKRLDGDPEWHRLRAGVTGLLLVCWFALVARAKPVAAFLVVAAVGWSLYWFVPRSAEPIDSFVPVPVAPSRAADPVPAPAPPVDRAPVAPAVVVGADNPVTLSAPRPAERVRSPIRVRGDVGEIDYDTPGSKVWLAVRDSGRLYFKAELTAFAGRAFEVPVVQRDGPAALVIVRLSADDHATVLEALQTEKQDRQARGFAAGALPSAQLLGEPVEIVVVAP
jgi:DNA-directed RNA polymerase specialized sigma24 family protein